jgi:NitT/TauT family transport system ATP-binding protein
MKNKKISCPIELTDVSHAFGKTLVIKNLNITVEHGEFVVLVGPSGCGKTTLLSLLSGHTKPDSGRVFRNGVTRAVYQHDSLFPWLTVSQNISMGLNVDEANQKDKDLKDLVDQSSGVRESLSSPAFRRHATTRRACTRGCGTFRYLVDG